MHAPLNKPIHLTAASALERRVHARLPLDRAVVALPVLPDGSPDMEHQLEGVTLDVSAGGMQLKLDRQLELREGATLAIGITEPSGGRTYEGVIVRHLRGGNGTQAIGGAFAGKVHQLLDPQSRMPELNAARMSYDLALPEQVLDRWAAAGVLRRVMLDTVDVCPKCGALPTSRKGCRTCGSGRLALEKMIHHFACAHVDTVAAYEAAAADRLVCPKCRTKNLIVGSDFEYLQVFRCLDCNWSDSDPKLVAHCLRCSHRYPAEQSATRELVGYDAQRFDVLALVPAPQ